MIDPHRPMPLGRPLTVRASRRRLIGALLGGTGVVLARLPLRHGGAQTPIAFATPSPSGAAIALQAALPSLTPPVVWARFYDLTRIPRPSHHEAQVSAYLAHFGRSLGLDTKVDAVGNVLIRKPATPGREDRPGVVLQAHMDMVPVKRSDVVHDFTTDPIDAVVDGGWVRATGTTLGADDGIGVALIMALLQATDVAHGPLEALFTVDEEDGFTGANALQPGVLHGTMLINVDSEEDGVFTIGSAGGVDVDATATYQEEPAAPDLTGVQLSVSGLQGGHSGTDIDRGRGNAIKLLARLLWTAQHQIPLRVAAIAGGDRYNAIPREAKALVGVPAAQAAPLATFIQAFAATVRQELPVADPGVTIAAAPTATPTALMPSETQRRLIEALYGSPNGVMRMSDRVPGLVETSTNLGTVTAADGAFTAGFLVRSAVDSERDDVEHMIASVFELAGANVVAHDAYSGWTPNPASPLLALMQTVYRDLTGHDATVTAIHAGLETSVIGAKYPGMDMISVGPTMTGVHSPDERLEIATVGHVYDLLAATLARIPAAVAGTPRPGAG